MFKVKDLMINVLAGGRGGSVAQPTPTEPTPPSPISPVAVVTAYSPRFELVDAVVEFPERADKALLDRAALDIGRAVVGARLAALCTQDMATCQGGFISPYARDGIGVLRDADFGVLRDHVVQSTKWLAEREELLEQRAVEHRKELLPRLEAAVKHLKSRR